MQYVAIYGDSNPNYVSDWFKIANLEKTCQKGIKKL